MATIIDWAYAALDWLSFRAYRRRRELAARTKCDEVRLAAKERL